MPSLKETKKRIGSVKNTQKITRAMKLVSSAKYAKASRVLSCAKAYSQELKTLTTTVLSGKNLSHLPYFKSLGEGGVTRLYIVATDRGLCGGLNSNLLKVCQSFLDERKRQGDRVDLILWGKRAEYFSSGLYGNTIDRKQKVLDHPDLSLARTSAKELLNLKSTNKIDKAYVIYPKFVNAISQKPTVEQLVPLSIDLQSANANPLAVVEPAANEMVPGLMESVLTDQLFNILLSACASEHAARMTAMENATNNAQEVIKTLTLEYNRARQAAITKELIEITSGAEAL